MPAKQIYDLSGKFQAAFDFFNEKLFANKLPQVIITTQRHRGAYGFFCPESYIQRAFDEDGDMLVPEYQVHEISIMPDNMYGRPDRAQRTDLPPQLSLWPALWPAVLRCERREWKPPRAP